EKRGRTVLSEKDAKQAFNQYGGDRLEWDADYVEATHKDYGAKKTAGQRVKPEGLGLAMAPSGRVVGLGSQAALPKSKTDESLEQQEPRTKDASEVKREHDAELRRATANAALSAVMESKHTAAGDKAWLLTLVNASMHTIHRDGLKAVAFRRGL